ncbi:uncharacterized protein LOC118252253 [Cygnus atratus]|uniref:uncharacterized protein LOC118252253 n=1 Tax=Cygnus atratus TaxID=8868 RepID=UPI0015D5B37B|nr:uncharacterized protein LOC118252253 [Cygnus atratus]
MGPTARLGGTGTQQLWGGDTQAHSQPGGAGSAPPSPKNSPERPGEHLGKSTAKFFFISTRRSPKCLIRPRSRNTFLPVWFQGSRGERQGASCPAKLRGTQRAFPGGILAEPASTRRDKMMGWTDRQTASCTPAFTTAAHTRCLSGSSVLHVTSDMGQGGKSLECKLALLTHGHPASCPGLSWRRRPGQKALCFPQEAPALGSEKELQSIMQVLFPLPPQRCLPGARGGSCKGLGWKEACRVSPPLVSQRKTYHPPQAGPKAPAKTGDAACSVCIARVLSAVHRHPSSRPGGPSEDAAVPTC